MNRDRINLILRDHDKLRTLVNKEIDTLDTSCNKVAPFLFGTIVGSVILGGILAWSTY